VVSVIKEIFCVCSENHMIPINTHCGQNSDLVNGEAFGTPRCFKGKTIRVFSH
jgi:hypothetical protein